MFHKIWMGMLVLACWGQTAVGDLWFQSANLRPLEFSVTGAALVSASADQTEIRRQIYQQLDFSIGPLNAMGAGPSLELTADISRIESTENPAGGFDVSYDVSFHIFWPQYVPVPSSLELVLPRRADKEGLTAFYEAYKGKCQIPDDEGALTFFYYYRPLFPKCPLNTKDPNVPEPTAVRTVFAVTQVGSYLAPPARPDYATYWADGVLDVIAWFGPNDETTSSNGGRLFVNRMLRHFHGNIAVEKSAQTRMHSWRMELPGPLGKVRMTVLELRNGTVLDAPPEMVKRFKGAALDADLVIYGGHSGYGEQLRSITGWSAEVARKKQFHYLHGCDVGSYLDGSLLYHPQQKMEVVANATSGYFGYMVSHGFKVFRSLLEGRNSWVRLLSQVPVGDPVALGPEDRAD